MYSNGPLHTAEQIRGDQLVPTYSSSVKIRVLTLRTCQKRWTIGRGGERESGIYHSLDCSTLPLIRTLVLSKDVSSTLFGPLVWLNLGSNRGLSAHWRTLYPLGQWEVLFNQLQGGVKGSIHTKLCSVYSLKE